MLALSLKCWHTMSKKILPNDIALDKSMHLMLWMCECMHDSIQLQIYPFFSCGQFHLNIFYNVILCWSTWDHRFWVSILKNCLHHKVQNHIICNMYCWVYHNSFDCVWVYGCTDVFNIVNRQQTLLQPKLNVSMTICFVANAFVQRYHSIRFAIPKVSWHKNETE